MRKKREVLRLKWGRGLGERTVSASCSLSRSTVSKYVRRAREAGLSWPLPEGLTDEQLERFPFSSGGRGTPLCAGLDRSTPAVLPHRCP